MAHIMTDLHMASWPWALDCRGRNFSKCKKRRL